MDLWRTGWRLLQRGGCSLDIRWTAAHRKASQATGMRDLWKILNTSLTDRDADFQKHPWPLNVQPVYDSLVDANELDTLRKVSVTRYIRAVWDAHEDCNEQ